MHFNLLSIQTEPWVALFISIIIFLITIFLVARQIIGFSIAFLLLLFALAAGVIINNHSSVQYYVKEKSGVVSGLTTTQEASINELRQLVEQLKQSIQIEQQFLKNVQLDLEQLKKRMNTQEHSLIQLIQEEKPDVLEVQENNTHISDGETKTIDGEEKI